MLNNQTEILEPDFYAYEEALKAQDKNIKPLEAIPTITPQTAPQTVQDKQESKGEALPFGYIYREKGDRKGIYKIVPDKDETQPPKQIWIGDLLYFVGFVRDNYSKGWGVLCRWHDPNGIEHQEVIHFQDITSPNVDWLTTLSNGGYRTNNRKELVNIFNQITPKTNYLSVNKIGWQGKSYILPCKSFKHAQESQEYFLDMQAPAGLYQEGGKLEEWQEVKTLIQGNSRLEFAYLVAFAGVLLNVAGYESGGFAFEGGSSSGKTTALQVACSVWGSKEHLRQWRATANGLEGLAVLHNDNLLILDELGQVSPREVNDAIYMLANGQGKSRSTKNGDSKQAKKWGLIYISSGEIGISQKLAEDGKKAKAGQEVRYIGISTQKEHIQALHGLKTSQELVDRVKSLTENNYGFDGVRFIDFVVSHYDGIKSKIHSYLDRYTKEFYQDDNSQIKRVAKRFALIEYTRQLLIGCKLIPDTFAVDTVKACFDDWLACRETSENLEEQEVLNTVRAFIETYPNKFQDIRFEFGGNERAGFKDITSEQVTYYFFSEYFKNNVLRDFRLKDACKTLTSNGWLKTEKGRNQIRKQFHNERYQLYYAIVLPETNQF